MKRFALLVISFAACLSALAQGSVCPGWKNPTTFDTYSSTSYWTAKVGDRINGGASVGNNIMSTCAYSFTPSYRNNSQITSSSLYSGNCTYTVNTCGHSFSDANDHRFTIYTAADAGLDQFTVNSQGQGMQRIPDGYQSSIRLGDMRSTGSCVQTSNLQSGNNKGSEALFYTTRIQPQNALMYINYAVVARRYDHTPQEAGEFIIRVVGHDAQGHWNNFPINDSLWYSVPAPHFAGTLPEPWVAGLPGPAAGGTTCSYCYKPWTLVALNLSQYLYDSVRIELYTSDCIYNVDPIYAYVTGDYQPLSLQSKGCAKGSSLAIDTLVAPENLLSYQWFCSTSGPINAYNPIELAATNFRPVTPIAGQNASGNVYLPSLADFIPSEGANVGDTLGEQTFKCIVTSALDPSKPFTTELFANVRNVKPVVHFDQEADCSQTINLHAQHYTRYGGVIQTVDSATSWVFFDNVACSGTPLDSIVGTDATYQYASGGNKGIRVTAYTDDSTCYTTANFVVRIPESPEALINVQRDGYCVDDPVTLVDMSSPAEHERTWIINEDTLVGTTSDQYQSLTQLLERNNNDVTLIVTNDDGCTDTAYQVVQVFHSPDLLVVGDTFVCDGTRTNVTVTSPVVGCTFKWYRQAGDTSQPPIAQGASLEVTPTDPVNSYYALVTSPQGCTAWDSVHIYRVSSIVSSIPADGNICFGDTAWLIASGADHYAWNADPYDPAIDAQQGRDTIVVHPQSTTTYELTGFGPAPANCMANPVHKLINVIPYPVLDWELSPSYIDRQEPIVVFTDLSAYRDHTHWILGDGAEFSGSPVSHHFEQFADSMQVTMQSYNKLGCMNDTSFFIPVVEFGVWLPNAFTPGLSENNTFHLFTVNDLEDFTIYIYDRWGVLVFSSTDPHFVWDGTCNGVNCPQASYTYIYRYHRAGRNDYHTYKGTITLIR